MTASLRIGVLGLTHDHIWGNLDDLQRSERGPFVGAPDTNLPRLGKGAD